MAELTSAPSARADRLGGYLTAISVIVGLSLPAVAPEVANVSYLALVPIGLWLRPRRRLIDRSLQTTLLALCAGVLLLVSTLLATRDIGGVVPAIYFLPLYAAGAFAVVLGKVSLSQTSMAAAAGSIGGLAIALYDAFILGLPGPGATVNNPIHFANIVITLSFVSMIGLYDSRPRIWLIGIVGAAAGLAALWLSQARGPLIALPPMLAAGALIVIWQASGKRWRPLLLLLALGAGGFGLWLVWWGRVLDSFGPFSDAMLLLRDGTIIDHSTWERVTMYQAAWNALIASPIYGHGLSNLASTAALYVPEGAELKIYDHLHSDLADFAVAGGFMGLVGYFFLLSLPLCAVDWGGRSRSARAACFLALTASAGYFVMGLTNAMFGVLTQTVLYSVIIALLLVLSSKPDGKRA